MSRSIAGKGEGDKYSEVLRNVDFSNRVLAYVTNMIRGLVSSWCKGGSVDGVSVSCWKQHPTFTRARIASRSYKHTAVNGCVMTMF